jgi:inorganic pyrophosphatase
MYDEAGRDWKIIGVAVGDTRMASIRAIDDVNDHTRREIEHFFETYKNLEGKSVTVSGWLGRDDAHRVISEAWERFRGGGARR